MAARRPVRTRRRGLKLALAIGLVAYGAALLLVLTRPGAALSGDRRVTIRFTHWQIEAGPREAFDALVKRYEELNPHVRVEQAAVPGNVYNQWLRTQLIGGTASDIIEFGRHMQGMNDVPPRFFAPISTYVEQPNPYNRGTPLEGVPWRDTFKDGLNTPDTYIENLSNYYAVTQCMLSMRLFYNPRLLREISGRAEPPADYLAFLDLNRKVVAHNAAGGPHLSLLAGSQFNGYILMSPLLSRAGLAVTFGMDRFRDHGPLALDAGLEFLRGTWNYDRPELREGFDMIREVALTMRPGFQQLERDAAVQEFLRGRALMIVTGTWDATSLRRLAPFEVGVADFPWPTRADGERGRYLFSPLTEGGGTTSMALYLNKASKHPAEAIDFLRFITSIEGNTIFSRTSGWLPSVRDVPVPEYAKVYLPHFEGFWGRTEFIRGFGAETRDLWDRQSYRLISPQGSVEDFLAAFEPRFPAALRRDLETNQRNVILSLRRDLPSLTALTALERLAGPDADRAAGRASRESSQNLVEAKLYEAAAVLQPGGE